MASDGLCIQILPKPPVHARHTEDVIPASLRHIVQQSFSVQQATCERVNEDLRVLQKCAPKPRVPLKLGCSFRKPLKSSYRCALRFVPVSAGGVTKDERCGGVSNTSGEGVAACISFDFLIFLSEPLPLAQRVPALLSRAFQPPSPVQRRHACELPMARHFKAGFHLDVRISNLSILSPGDDSPLCLPIMVENNLLTISPTTVEPTISSIASL